MQKKRTTEYKGFTIHKGKNTRGHFNFVFYTDGDYQVFKSMTAAMENIDARIKAGK